MEAQIQKAADNQDEKDNNNKNELEQKEENIVKRTRTQESISPLLGLDNTGVSEDAVNDVFLASKYLRDREVVFNSDMTQHYNNDYNICTSPQWISKVLQNLFHI
ncbi:1575_t:CDS:2 [Funneliformis mosseae]|uniref:1575_t:CDS:1 n=1 Tax=Funneliformis mosseae TaxID=27381 RepID=A0A9N9BNU8_FUNMO|nr:1575_t:CDS:2 [Funneliformis mosseae]